MLRNLSQAKIILRDRWIFTMQVSFILPTFRLSVTFIFVLAFSFVFSTVFSAFSISYIASIIIIIAFTPVFSIIIHHYPDWGGEWF